MNQETAAEPILRCVDVSKEFLMHLRGGKRIVGFEDISLSVARGRFLGVQGRSGIGKSSLLKCIYRTYLPDSGQMWYRGSDGVIDLAAAGDHEILALRKREIGYISQFFHVIPRITALETIRKVVRSMGHDEAESTERAVALLKRLRIPEPLWEMFPSTFSGGEKQRINIIHAVVWKPRLLLLDEPTASLDAAAAEEVLSLIEELKFEGTAMIGVFHDTDTLMRLSDDVFEMPERPEVPSAV